MNMRISLLCIALGLTGHSGLAQAETVELYRHLVFRESPYAPIRGIHPLTKHAAQQAAHYRFVYDDQGRLTEVSHRLGDRIIGHNGNWDNFIWFAPKVRIEYSANQEIHHYYSIDDTPAAAHGKVLKAAYQLGAGGQRTALQFFDAEGQPVESEWGIQRYQWQSDSQGRIIEQRFNLANEQVRIRPEFEFFEVRLTYDRDGLLSFMHHYGKDGQPTNNSSGAGIDRIVYDLNGNFVRWQVYDKDGNAVEGNEPMVHQGEDLYDGLGNKIGLRGFDRHGKRIAFSDGSYEIRTVYDRFGNQSEFRILAEDGSLAGHLRHEYSADGLQRQWIKSFDQEGRLSPSPALGGAAALQFVYESGARTPSGRRLLNAELGPFNSGEG
ncbi:hypothetical protein [Pseudomarimonas arenosa]|uniref:YD repeat-containing protein n=1 Tax=Pseudomarimonas arenosa TaxID=2774145 RepID=A0AAW3ZDF7_9GAMM|nr:hypothetical protein [Pseudomarimonas arenosa]MBD8524253.1 hypothetical protein [Pseudomarimonas arenosa]